MFFSNKQTQHEAAVSSWSGLLSLDHFAVMAFDLDKANEAVAHAAADSSPCRLTFIQP